jgi:dephospho-CoA kinase
MNLIYIYGPPASGKLTIANELIRLTGYKLFHNHSAQDLVGTIYPEWNNLRHKLVEKLRLDVFQYAAQNNTNLVYTQYYTGDEDDILFVRCVVDIVSKHEGLVNFVEITAPLEILQTRVTNKSRMPFGKAKDVETLQKHLDASVESSVQYGKIIIDSSKRDPTAGAQTIVDAFQLV